MTRLEQLNQLHKKEPDESFIWFALAKEYEKLGAEKKAMHWYQKLISDAPGEVGTYYHLAQLLARQQKYAEAYQIIKLGKETALHQKDMHALSELNRLNQEIEEE